MNRLLSTLAVLSLALCPTPLLACAACFGQTDDKLAEGMNAGIMTLLVIITCVLAGVAAFFINLARKSKS
jgi:hypothetical protein